MTSLAPSSKPTSIMVWTRSNCGRFAIGPWVVLSASGSPTTSSEAVAAARTSTFAICERNTSMRVGALQDWPRLRKAARTPSGTARRKSASGKMIFDDLPPSSWATRLTVGAAACATRTPARVEPVIEIMSTCGCDARAAPTIGPVPLTRLMTPGGQPASCITSANSKALSGDNSLGFNTTVQPAASAGPTLAVIW